MRNINIKYYYCYYYYCCYCYCYCYCHCYFFVIVIVIVIVIYITLFFLPLFLLRIELKLSERLLRVKVNEWLQVVWCTFEDVFLDIFKIKTKSKPPYSLLFRVLPVRENLRSFCTVKIPRQKYGVLYIGEYCTLKYCIPLGFRSGICWEGVILVTRRRLYLIALTVLSVKHTSAEEKCRLIFMYFSSEIFLAEQ